jgi:hypothetical protein
VSLQGASQLRARVKAIRLVFKDAGAKWADATVPIARGYIPVRTGKTRASVRRRNASQRLATVVGNYPVNFIDGGTAAHEIKAKKAQTLKFVSNGTTFFRKKVNKPQQRGQPFKKRSADEGLRKVHVGQILIDLWNRAA